MAVTYSDSFLARSARGVMNQLGEFVHACAIYLGIAVLVTVALGMTVPSLRDQTRQMHTALVIALRPAGLKGDFGSSLDAWQNSLFSGLYGLDGAGDDIDPDGAKGAGGSAASASARASSASPQKSVSAAQISFGRALSASMAGQAIPGATPAQAQALRSYIARKYKIAHSVAGALVHTAFTVGRDMKLDPQLLLAVIAIESRYNPYAESHVGAQGLMQVMTKVHKEKFDLYAEGQAAALNPIANIRVGAQILDDCIRRRGSIESGLACYVGATGPTDGGYGAKVLAERGRIALASGISPQRN
jgi:hypothetical protein